MTQREAENREARINALLDGDLTAEESEALKAEAAADQELATAIIEAYRLQRAMDELQVERAPSRLRRRLRRIPREHRAPLLQPRWAFALAAVPVLVVSIVLMQPSTPSQQEIDQARRELVTAFAYIDAVSDRTFNRIEHEVGGELKQAVGQGLMQSIPKPKSETQEKQA